MLRDVGPMCDAQRMDRTVRAVLEGSDAAPGRIAATDVARLLLGLQTALMRAAHVVLGRPKRAPVGRYEADIERATRLRFVAVEEGSFAGVLALPDVTLSMEPAMDLDIADLGYLAWQRLLDAIDAPTEIGVDPMLAQAVARLAEDVNIAGRATRIRLEAIDAAGQVERQAVIDEGVRDRMRAVSVSEIQQQDVLTGRLMEADFEKRTARLHRPTSDKVTVIFAEDQADQVQAALREPGTFVGDVVYDQSTNRIVNIYLRQVVAAREQLPLFSDVTEFHEHRSVAELAAEQHVRGPQPLASLRSEVLDADDLTEFAESAEQL
jgi:hypothetical protein